MDSYNPQATKLIEMEDNFKELLLNCTNEMQVNQVRGKLDMIHKKYEETYIY